jgi:hypothetical protein
LTFYSHEKLISDEGRAMNGEIHQVASAMLVLVFAAMMLLTGLLYIEKSRRPFQARVPTSASILTLANEVGAVPSHK